MSNIRLIANIFFLIFFTIVACSPTSVNFYSDDIGNADTAYATSTLELKSEKIPDSVFRLSKLQHLSINGMDCDYGDRANCWMIKEIPTEIKNLKNLITLRLTLNAISTIPNELAELNKLELVDLTDNSGLTNVDVLTKLHNLQYLYLFGCGLTKLPDNINELKNLKELGLVGNHIEIAEQARIKKALPKCDIKF